MKIRFKKRRLYANLIVGIIWTGLGIFNVIETEALKWIDYGYLVVGFLYISHYLYDDFNQYLNIENGIIAKNEFFGFKKKIALNDVTLIKEYAGDYILQTEDEKLEINTTLIEDQSLKELNNVLKELNLPQDKTLQKLLDYK